VGIGLPVFQTINAAGDIALPCGFSIGKYPVAVPIEPVIEVVNFVLLHGVYRLKVKYQGHEPGHNGSG